MSSATLAMVEPSGVAATSRIHFAWASTVRTFDAGVQVPPDQLAVVAARDGACLPGDRQAGDVALVARPAHCGSGFSAARSTS